LSPVPRWYRRALFLSRRALNLQTTRQFADDHSSPGSSTFGAPTPALRAEGPASRCGRIVGVTRSRRLGLVALVAVAALVTVVGISVSGGSNPGRSDDRSAGALLLIARQFNEDYSANRDGAVYDRWDSASKRVISRARYVEFHRVCSTAPGPAVVEGATRARGGFWTVRYSIDGYRLLDYWHYVDGRWLFSLVKSNPGAVKLYKLPLRDYMVAAGCSEPAG
jgi:hypothetical protein